MLKRKMLVLTLAILFFGAIALEVFSPNTITKSLEIKDENKNSEEIILNIQPDIISNYRKNIFAISDEFSFEHMPYTDHDPLYIDGNENFNEENGVTAGKGTMDDPYIIEGWEIKCDIQDGIVIRNTSIFFIIKNCYIHNGETKKDGIVFYNVTNGTIKNNSIKGNRNGVMFRNQYPGKENSNYNIISNNSITYNTDDGIHFQHTGLGWHSMNSILSNNIFGNTRGIYMIMSAKNQILYNNITSNDGYGIQLDMCMGGGQNNIIHHNNFFNNNGKEGQVYELGGPLNFWNDSYPSGGNFWNDYDGEDFYNGPNQDLPGSDGIGDLSYYIPNGKNQDKYPLMEPYNLLNNPPDTPSISGETNGKVGVEYEYCLDYAVDPDGDSLYVWWDWGDDINTGWLGPYDSSEPICATHSWSEEGTYTVKAKLKDPYDAESDWATLTVSMPKTHVHNQILQLFTKILNRFLFFEKILNQIIL